MIRLVYLVTILLVRCEEIQYKSEPLRVACQNIREFLTDMGDN